MGLPRHSADEFLSVLRTLEFGVRADRPGKVVQDYQVAGAGNGIVQASGKLSVHNKEVVKEYLADASFLAVWRGAESVIQQIAEALNRPVYMPFLGRKCCTPSCPLLEGVVDSSTLRNTLETAPMKVRRGYDAPRKVWCVCDATQPGTFVVNDDPVSFAHRGHSGRSVSRFVASPPVQDIPVSKPVKLKMNLQVVQRRYELDDYLCVVCGDPATQSHHTTYRNKGREMIGEMRSLCAPCHLTVSYHEQMTGMGRTRIDPLDPIWYDLIRSQRIAMEQS
jgi:CRISPR system Cascade subunit CasD